jgi:hypothetical protein
MSAFSLSTKGNFLIRQIFQGRKSLEKFLHFELFSSYFIYQLRERNFFE